MRNWEDDYFDSEQFRELLDEYEQSLTQGSASYLDADDLTDIAEYYYLNRKADRAWQAINQALEQDPDAITPKTFVIRGYISNGDWEKVRTTLAAINDPLNENRELMYLRAELLIHDGQYQEADDLMQSNFPADAQASDQRTYMREVIGVYLDYNCERTAPYMRRWSERLENMSHRSTEDNMMLADMWSCQQEHDKSIDTLQDIVQQNPYKVQAWTLLAESYERAMRFEEAVDAARFALAIVPNDLDAMLVAERCQWVIDPHSVEHQRLIADMQAAYPSNPEILCVAASRCLARFTTTQNIAALLDARQLLEDALKCDIDNTADTFNILINLAYTYSAEYTSKAIKHDIDRHGMTDDVERELTVLHDTCIRYLEQAHICDAAQEDLYRLDIAGMYIAIDELLYARPHLEREVDIHPDSAQAQHSLGILLVDLQLYPLAIPYIQQAALLAPDMYDSLQHAPIAYCFYVMRMKKQCLHHLTQACSLTPEYTSEFFGNIYPHVDPHLYYMYVAHDMI